MSNDYDKTNHMVKSYVRWGRITAYTNEELTAELSARLGGALGTYLSPKSIVMIGRDYRRDSRALKRAFSGGLMASGQELIDLRAIPTSVLQFSVRRFGADAGVMFTRSHNLAGMVSIKFFDSTGIEFSSKNTQRIVDIAEKGKILRVTPSEVGWISVADAMTIYTSALSGFFSAQKDSLKKSVFRVVVDCACGPASFILPDLLSEFGCEIVTLNAHRPRNPLFFPNPESLSRLSETVRTIGADLGIALDAEARHVIIIDNKGKIRAAEETAAVNLNSRYEPNPDATVVIGVTVNPSVYQKLNKKIIFSKAGEPGGSSRLIFEHRAIFGFNDTGLFFFPQWSPGSDAIVASLIVLAQMAKEGIKSTELYNRFKLQTQKTIKKHFPLNQMFNFFKEILNNPPEGYNAVDTYIGIKLIKDDKEWIHFYLETENDSIGIEVHEPQNNPEIQKEMISFADNLVQNFLEESKVS